MGNDVAVKQAGGGLMGLAAKLSNLDNAVQDLVSDTGTTLGSYLQFSGKTGEYKLNGEPIEEGTVFAFGVEHGSKGIICWKDEKPTKRELVGILSGDAMPQAPHKDDILEGEEWRTLIEIPVRALDTGVQAVFGLSSAGGTRAMTRLVAEWAQRVRMHMEDSGNAKCCLVSVAAVKKDGKGDDGKKFYYFLPVFKIVEWVSASELFADLGAPVEEQQPEAEEEPEVVEEVVEERPKTTVLKKPAAPAPASAARPATGFGSGLRGVRK